MGKITKIRYFTKEKKDKINPENIAKYNKYLKSNIIKNKDVKDTTFKIYSSNFTQFLVYLSEEWKNIDLYDDKLFENAVDIMEGFISFCVETLKNNKKTINNKIAAVSSFYLSNITKNTPTSLGGR